MNNVKEIQEAIIRNKEGLKESVKLSFQTDIKSSDDKIKSFIISNETKDRDGEVMKMSGARIENYNKNPVVLWMHEVRRGPYDAGSYDPDNVIGKGKAKFEGGQLVNDIEFEPVELNEKADKIRKKIEFGSLSMTSIGFYPLDGHKGDKTKGEDNNAFYITDWELLEHSIVVVPANPTAGRKEAKRIGADLARARSRYLLTKNF